MTSHSRWLSYSIFSWIWDHKNKRGLSLYCCTKATTIEIITDFFFLLLKMQAIFVAKLLIIESVIIFYQFYTIFEPFRFWCKKKKKLNAKQFPKWPVSPVVCCLKKIGFTKNRIALRIMETQTKAWYLVLRSNPGKHYF